MNRIIQLAALTLAGACATPEPIVTTIADDAQLPCSVNEGAHHIELISTAPVRFSWTGDAWAAALTSPDAQLGSFGRIRTGRLFWSLAGEDFDVRLPPQLEYGVIPPTATNYTAFGGGTFAELESGRCYELQLSDATHRGFSRFQFRAP